MTVGYGLWGLSRRHPDYLAARRDNRLAPRLIDFPFSVPLRKEMIERALDFMDSMRAQGSKVLVHCVYGRSRSPSIGLLNMAARLHVLPVDSLEAAEERFWEIYPPYQPNRAIRGHLRRYWGEYCAEGDVSREAT
jgi:protein-tyrosine phosphatase